MLILIIILFAFFVGFILFHVIQIRRIQNAIKVPCVNIRSLLRITYDFVFGNKNIPSIYREIYDKFPNERFVGLYKLGTLELIVRDPDLINRILVKDFDYFTQITKKVDHSKVLSRLSNNINPYAAWKIYRKQLVRIFTPDKLRSFSKIMDETMVDLEEYLSHTSTKSTRIEIKEILFKYSLDVVGKFFFGLNFQTFKKSDTYYEKIGTSIAGNTVRKQFVSLMKFIQPELNIRLGIDEINDDCVNFFFNFFENVVRRHTTNTETDFVRWLVDMDEQNYFTEQRGNSHLAPDKDENYMTTVYLMYSFFLSGITFPTSLISSALHELTVNQNIQEKLRSELQNPESHDSVMSYETITKRLPYLDMFISELVRLYGSVPYIRRICVKPYRIPGTDTIIPPGTETIISLEAFHKDQKYYQDPEKFNPDRHQGGGKERMPFTYLPFAIGARVCPAERFIKLQLKHCIVWFILRFKFTPNEDTQTKLSPHSRTLHNRPGNDIWLTITKL